MEVAGKVYDLSFSINRKPIISFELIDSDVARDFYDKFNDKNIVLSVNQKIKKRSLNSNAYFWCLCEKIAQAVGTDKDSVYIDMLGKYGKFTHIIVKPEAVDRMMKEWRASKVLGEVLVNGNVGVQIQCYYGSSSYDQTEMNRLLQGTVDECHELGIDTLTPDEIAEMNSRWAV